MRAWPLGRALACSTGTRTRQSTGTVEGTYIASRRTAAPYGKLRAWTHPTALLRSRSQLCGPASGA